MYHAITDELGQAAAYVRHDNTDPTALDAFDVITIPGGSSYGDALRPGAIAANSGIMPALHRANAAGKTILGICNGFQILTEAGLLPGALLRNPSMQFICKTTPIKVVTNANRFTRLYERGAVVQYPIAHSSGNYYCDPATLAAMQANNQIVFTYEDNPNSSLSNIAGITNPAGNVLGLMPHPERALNAMLGNTDGLPLFKALIQ
jgi:phosphoribosylformylglycinamidine synthase